jgi:hypothetical protein
MAERRARAVRHLLRDLLSEPGRWLRHLLGDD